LPELRANVDFSQSSLSGEGTEADRPRAPKLFEHFLPEQKVRVLQAPSRERPWAARRAKSTLSEQTGRFILLILLYGQRKIRIGGYFFSFFSKT
jgi:hypothetical protein